MTMPTSGPPDLTNQVALLTGSTGDIGPITARNLANCGATVIATDIHEESDVFAGDSKIHYRCLDVTSKADADTVVADVAADISSGLGNNVCFLRFCNTQLSIPPPGSFPDLRVHLMTLSDKPFS